MGRKLITLITCNIYEKNQKFGWKSEKPFPTQVTLLLEPELEYTKLTWTVESEQVDIVQLAEPLLIKQTNEMIQKSIKGLQAYLRTKNFETTTAKSSQGVAPNSHNL